MSSTRQPLSIHLAKRTIFIRGPKRFRLVAWALVGVALVVLILALVMPYWLPHTIRMVVPDRYIVAYAPKFIQNALYAQESTDLGSNFSPQGSSQDAARLQSLLATPTASATSAAPIGTRVAAQPAASPTASATAWPPAPPSFSLGQSNFKETYQGWNNCGPATLTMYLNYLGVPSTQEVVAAYVKPNPEDRNVRPDELAGYVESVGLKVIVRIDGTPELLKRFISHGYPIMVEQGFEVPNVPGWMGHYALFYAYSDTDQAFYAMDSYEGPAHAYTYDHIQTYWRDFNRTYLVAYRPQQAAEVASLIGPDMDDKTMYENALEVAKNDVSSSPGDVFGWWNLGSSLVGLGDNANAAAAFDASFNTGKVPQRMLWYQFGPFVAYMGVGRYKDVVNLADDVISRAGWEDPYSEEAYYYKAMAYSAQGDTYNAERQLQLALLYNKHYKTAQDALNKLIQQ